MARFSEQFIQQVAQATDIVELVSRYVALKQRGKEFVGLCPFHQDQRPSLNVSPAKQIFKCFACGAGGGVFQFLMLYDKLTFPQAVETLAERANIPLPVDAAAPPAEQGLSKTDLLKVVQFASAFFTEQLWSAHGRAALDYARQRGLTDESIRRFSLGYAPAGWDALTAAAGKKFSQAQLVAAGLAVRREGDAGAAGDQGWREVENSRGCYDRFRNRLIFPIIDVQGRVIAFGGRALDPNDRAKYLNSPEGPLFDKSSNLYALNWSREGIVSTGLAIVVEGYMDAVAPLQAGVNNVVATLGTALTDTHVRMLGRYAREVVLLFDSDQAGQAAANRSLELFLAQQVHVRVAHVPSGKDPCDFVLAEGGEALAALAASAPDAIEHAWSLRSGEIAAAGGDLAARGRAVEQFLKLVVSSAAYGAIDEVRRGQLAQRIAHLVGASARDLQAQMRAMVRQVPRGGSGQGKAAPVGAAPQAEREVLEVLLNCPALLDHAAERIWPADFQDDVLRAIAQEMWRRGPSGVAGVDELMAAEALWPHAALLADLATAGERRGNYEQTLNGAVEFLLYRRNRQDMERLKNSGLSDDTLRRLDQQFRQADPRRHPRIT